MIGLFLRHFLVSPSLVVTHTGYLLTQALHDAALSYVPTTGYQSKAAIKSKELSQRQYRTRRKTAKARPALPPLHTFTPRQSPPTTPSSAWYASCTPYVSLSTTHPRLHNPPRPLKSSLIPLMRPRLCR